MSRDGATAANQLSFMRTIFLHIGLGKTGTTAIQRFLSAQRIELAACDVHYIHADGGTTGVGHQNFGKGFIRHLPDIMIPPIDPIIVRDQIRDEIRSVDANHVIISSENLELADVSDVREFFQQMPDCCVKVVVFVRSQDELAESQYNQLVKLKAENRTFERYLDDTWRGFDALPMIEDWSRHFGEENIICRVYDASGPNVLQVFLDSLEVPTLAKFDLDSFSSAPRAANESIGFRALTAAWLLNSIEIRDRDRLYQEIFEQMAAQDLPALLFDSQQATAFRERFADSNTDLSTRFLGVATSDLGGRRYDDERRDAIRSQILDLKLVP